MTPTTTATTPFEQLDFEDTARQVYDAFLISLPEVPVEGLFRQGNRFTIVARNLDTIVEEKMSVREWFDNRLRPLGMPIFLADSRPDESTAVRSRSAEEVGDTLGVVRTRASARRDLALFLPRDFPLAGMEEIDRTFVVYVSRELGDAEARALDAVYERWGAPLPYRVEVRPEAQLTERKLALELTAAKFLGDATPRAVRAFVDADEDFWRTNYRRLFGGSLSREDVLQRPRDGETCLVSTTAPPQNLRSYLSLYRRAVLGLPLKDSVEETLQGLGVSKRDLLELVHLGHVSFVAPQAVERYDADFLATLLDANDGAVVGSRRLAAAAHADQLERNPLLVLPGAPMERRSALRALVRLSTASGEQERLSASIAKGLANVWPYYEYGLHERGAMASIDGPLANVARSFASAVTGNDYFLELGAAAQYIEWASALGAHYAPFEGDGYSEVGHAQLLAALHSGADGRGNLALARPAEFEVAKSLLVIDNDVNVLDFVRELGVGDLARFRTLVGDLARPGRSRDEVDELVSLWNSQIRSYERRPDRLQSMGLAGAALFIGANAAGAPQLVSLSALFLPALLTLLREDGTAESKTLGVTLDTLNARLAGVQRDAVLLSRMRRQVKGMK